MTDGPLAGLRIVEVASFVATPLAGMTLAQLGAEVIRVDPLGGAADITRWPVTTAGTSLYWSGLNKGKKSIMIDFKDPSGQRVVANLLRESGANGGILLTNAVGRPWLEYEQLRAERSDLIHVHVQGYPDGRAAVDYLVNAEVGIPLLTGPEAHAAPVNHVLPAWDVACGLYAALAVLVAERRRRETGLGDSVAVALSDVALATVANLGWLAEAQVSGVRRNPIGNHVYGGFGREFATRDGHWVMLVVLTTRHWYSLLELTGLSKAIAALEEALDVDFTDESTRYAHREVIAGLVAPWFANRDLPDVQAALRTGNVLWSTYRSLVDLADELVVAGAPLLDQIDQPGIGPVLTPKSPVRFTQAGNVPALAAPVLGADTASIIAGLGPAVQ